MHCDKSSHSFFHSKAFPNGFQILRRLSPTIKKHNLLLLMTKNDQRKPKKETDVKWKLDSRKQA